MNLLSLSTILTPILLLLSKLLKDIARVRPDLKILISSATLDAKKFSDYYDEAPIFNSKISIDIKLK